MQKIDWQQPIPLANHTEEAPAPYPIESLPKELAQPIMSYQTYGQQPIALIACAALANVSLACQTLANVARDSVLTSPVSMYFICINLSGERKSQVDRTFSQGIHQWQKEVRQKLMPEVIEMTAMHNAWKAERDGLLKQIRQTNLAEELRYLQDQYKTLAGQEPQIPLLPELFFEDITQEALIHSLSKGWPSSSLWSDEGGIVLSSSGMQTNTTKFITTLNRLWDGNAFRTHRKTSSNLSVEHRRFTLSLMLQPFLLEYLLKKQDSVARQSGFLARSMIAQPVSSMGNRYYQAPPNALSELDDFHDRIKTCLDASLNLDHHGCHNIPTLHFSAKAKARWISFFNKIESGMNKPHQWQSMQDFASKAAENVARLSALFHLFLGKSGMITPESVEQATEIVHWHLSEAKRILGPTEHQEKNKDAKRMLAWLKSKNITQTSSRQLQQTAGFRDKAKREEAIQLLIEHN